MINAFAHTSPIHIPAPGVYPFLKYFPNLSSPELQSTVETGIESRGFQPHPTLLNPEELFTAPKKLELLDFKFLWQ